MSARDDAQGLEFPFLATVNALTGAQSTGNGKRQV